MGCNLPRPFPEMRPFIPRSLTACAGMTRALRKWLPANHRNVESHGLAVFAGRTSPAHPLQLAWLQAISYSITHERFADSEGHAWRRRNHEWRQLRCQQPRSGPDIGHANVTRRGGLLAERRDVTRPD